MGCTRRYKAAFSLLSTNRLPHPWTMDCLRVRVFGIGNRGTLPLDPEKRFFVLLRIFQPQLELDLNCSDTARIWQPLDSRDCHAPNSALGPTNCTDVFALLRLCSKSAKVFIPTKSKMTRADQALASIARTCRSFTGKSFLRIYSTIQTNHVSSPCQRSHICGEFSFVWGRSFDACPRIYGCRMETKNWSILLNLSGYE
jgi:hypothetical protein